MTVQEIINAFIGVFTNFSPIYILETVLLFLLIYFVFKILKNNDAKQLIVVFIAIVVLTGALCLFVKEAGVVVFLFSVLLAAMFMLLLFSQEIKRGLHDRKNNSSIGNSSLRWTRPETEACIEAIIKALQNLSKNDVGALVVLSNGNLPKQILESGTMLNADISQQLIEGVFFPKAPLHDGAMIIDEHKIIAAGCFLPLTQNNEKYPKDLGTRHRAGIGITEVINVTSLIVSEETGIISIVKQGKVTRYADYNMLRAVLQEYYWKDFTADSTKKKGAK